MSTIIQPPMLVDSRVGSKDLIKHPPLSTCGILCVLESGDVVINGNGPKGSVSIGVEVKSIFDIIASLESGRVQTQLKRMLGIYDRNYLLTYGIYKCDPKTGALIILKGNAWQKYRIGSRYIPFGYVEGFLVEVEELGVTCKHVQDIPTAVSWLGCLSRWWGKSWDDHKAFRKFDTSNRLGLIPEIDPHIGYKAKVAHELMPGSGMGFKRSMAAAEYFSTVGDMVNATANEWASVPGVGKVIAKTVTAAVRGQV